MPSSRLSRNALGASALVLLTVALVAGWGLDGTVGFSGQGTGAESGAAPGGFNEQVVARTVRTQLPSIRACYERYLRQDPYLAGKVTVELTIEVGGAVGAIRAAENTTRNPAVADCIVRTVGRLRFAPGPTGDRVTYAYPFVFQADYP